MPQLNVHVPASSDLLARIDAAAQQLGTTPSALARVILEVALEPYVQAQLERRQQEQLASARVIASLRHRLSGALPARPFVVAGDPDALDDTGHASDAGDADDARLGVSEAVDPGSGARIAVARGAPSPALPPGRPTRAARRSLAAEPASPATGRRRPRGERSSHPTAPDVAVATDLPVTVR
jgi:hypothetical protein